MRVTLGQYLPILGEKQKNLEKMNQVMKKAKEDNSDIVLFPELALTGYYIGSSIDQMSESLNEGKSIKTIQNMCREFNIYAVFTFAEKWEGDYYNSAALVDNRGNVAGIYRKIHLFDSEKEVFQSGDRFTVIDTPFGRVGMMICFDLEFPEVARVLKLNGAGIILVPTNNMVPYQEYQRSYLKSRAMENEIPIVLCNRIGTEDDTVFFGQSACIDAKGNTLVWLGGGEETKTIEIPMNTNPDPKLNYFKNRRPVLYKRLIDA